MDCTKPFPANLGNFDDIFGTCDIFAVEWRDGKYKSGEIVPIKMGDDITIYVAGTWLGDDDEEKYGAKNFD